MGFGILCRRLRFCWIKFFFFQKSVGVYYYVCIVKECTGSMDTIRKRRRNGSENEKIRKHHIYI